MRSDYELNEIRQLTKLCDVNDPLQLTRLTNKEDDSEKVLSAFEIRGDTCNILFDELDEARRRLEELELEHGVLVTGLARRLKLERTEHSLASLVFLMQDRFTDLESGLHEIAASFERQPDDADDPGEVARIVKDEARRLGELEAELKDARAKRRATNRLRSGVERWRKRLKDFAQERGWDPCEDDDRAEDWAISRIKGLERRIAQHEVVSEIIEISSGRAPEPSQSEEKP